VSPPSYNTNLTPDSITWAEYRPTRDWVLVDTTVEKAERLLATDLIFYTKGSGDHTIIRAANEYSIPDDVAEVVDFVGGLQGFPYSSWKPVAYDNTLPATGNTPATVYKLYGITVPTKSCNCNSSQAVVEFSSANYSPTDLQQFFSEYAPDLEGETLENIYGKNNGNGFISVEANLDVQYIMAIGAFIPTDDYVVPRNPDILDAFLQYQYVVGNQTNPPFVHSISWGEYGGDYDNKTVQRVNNEFMLMSARGITVCVASGDNGVGCGDNCQSQEFDFPSSPYITMVGSTGLNSQGKEQGATFSSGGFSRDYYQPTWQATAVTNYFKSGVDEPSIYYDAMGRGYPDVSALGVSLNIIARGREQSVDGTSASAPIFGAIISLLNAQRSLVGKGPLGYINPWIYQNAAMFNDVTTGSNPYKCCEGFTAASGWDPVTGLGTPNYPKMLKSALALR
jgi:tripeptidyl-peptidase I